MTKSTWTIYRNIAGSVAKCDKCGFAHVIDTKKTWQPPKYCPSCAYKEWAEMEKKTEHFATDDILFRRFGKISGFDGYFWESSKSLNPNTGIWEPFRSWHRHVPTDEVQSIQFVCPRCGKRGYHKEKLYSPGGLAFHCGQCGMIWQKYKKDHLTNGVCCPKA